MEIPRSEVKNAVFNGKCYEYFGIHPKTCSLYGKDPTDIVQVEISVSTDQTDPGADSHRNPTADYWAWWDNEEQHFTLVYAKHFLLGMCFIYGMEVEEKAGKGKAYRVNVKQVSNDTGITEVTV